MKSFVVIDQHYLEDAGFLQQFCFEGTRAIPCVEVPKDVGPYLEIKPASLKGTDPLSDHAGPEIDGSIRVPHAFVSLIVDSADDRLLGFLDHSLTSPSQK